MTIKSAWRVIPPLPTITHLQAVILWELSKAPMSSAELHGLLKRDAGYGSSKQSLFVCTDKLCISGLIEKAKGRWEATPEGRLALDGVSRFYRAL